MVEFLIYLGAGLIIILVPLFYILRERRKSKKARETLNRAIETGKDEPVSLHPFINPDKCIGSGACVKACPEHDVLGLISNRGQLINPSRCIGHGLCAASCPVQAIDLVIGTEKRGVDIPHVNGRFETNVKGIYIAGELGGMGLIRNAVEQGRQASSFIASSLKQDTTITDPDVLDLVIVGAGPAGISASLQAVKDELKFELLDQNDLGGTVRTYPRNKLVMTQPMVLPEYGKINLREVQKEKLMEIFEEAAGQKGIKVKANQKVQDIVNSKGIFEVFTQTETFKAKRVLLTIGRRGSPRKLGIPGENLNKVSYSYIDPKYYIDAKILIVGGGDSAVEAAVSLSEIPGNIVHLSYRKENIFRVKEGNQTRLDEAIANGKVTPVFNSNVTEIRETEVTIQIGDKSTVLENDYIFILIGGELPTPFLKKVGINFTRKHGEKLDAN